MIKIKNPFSKNRFTLKEKAQKKFTRIVVPWIRKIPLNEDYNAKRKFIPQFLNRIRIDLEYGRRDLWGNSIPQGDDVNLLSVYVAEYIPIEDIDKLNKGLKKAFKEFSPRFNTNRISNIDDFCNSVKQSIHGKRWSNFGYLEFDENDKLSKFVKRISVHGSQISSSSVIIEFSIEPSENFKKEYQKLIKSHVKVETILTPKIKSFFKFWGSKTPSNVIVKQQMVEDLLLELKWRTLKELGKYINMYFYKNKLIPPSIEVFRIKQKSCKLKYEENEKINQFWESIGMGDYSFHEISKDGYWQLFDNEKDYSIGNSIKLTCNDEIQKASMFHSLDSQMVYFVKEIAMNLFPVLVMRTYTLGLSKKIAEQQENTFKSIKKESPNYKKLINIRYQLEQNLQILKRFKNEMGENEFEHKKREINGMLSDFEPADPRFRSSDTSWGEMIVDNTNYLIEKTNTLSQNFASIIDDTVRLLEIKTNNSLRKITFWLTILTIILSVIATVIAGMSLYLQLDEPNKDKIKDFISSVVIFFS